MTALVAMGFLLCFATGFLTGLVCGIRHEEKNKNRDNDHINGL